VETLSDLYRDNPEPTGFRLRKNGGRSLGTYGSYEAVEQAAKTMGLPANDWKAEPVYGNPSTKKSR
jgi:hypothetical protein